MSFVKSKTSENHLQNQEEFDRNFKAKFEDGALNRQTTLVLKTSFHTINVLLMGLCQVYKNMNVKASLKDMLVLTHIIDLKKF
jgi:hypothetical protein